MRAPLLSLVIVLCSSCAPSTDQFIERFEPAMVDYFCDAKKFFRSCYDINETQCLALAKPAVRTCIEKYRDQMPKKFDEQSGAKIGELVGACAGEAFGTGIDAGHKRTDPSARCDDPRNTTYWPAN